MTLTAYALIEKEQATNNKFLKFNDDLLADIIGHKIVKMGHRKKWIKIKNSINDEYSMRTISIVINGVK